MENLRDHSVRRRNNESHEKAVTTKLFTLCGIIVAVEPFTIWVLVAMYLQFLPRGNSRLGNFSSFYSNCRDMAFHGRWGCRGSYNYINSRTHNKAFAFSLTQTNLQFHLLYFTLLLFCLIIYNLLFQVFNISVLFACVQVKCSIAIQYAVTDGIQWIINQLQLPEAARIFTFTRIRIFKDYLQRK